MFGRCLICPLTTAYHGTVMNTLAQQFCKQFRLMWTFAHPWARETLAQSPQQHSINLQPWDQGPAPWAPSLPHASWPR